MEHEEGRQNATWSDCKQTQDEVHFLCHAPWGKGGAGRDGWDGVVSGLSGVCQQHV